MKLSIKNYKCFLQQDIEFGKLTVLAGANSAGKSSTVQSLLLMRLALEQKQANKKTVPVNGEYCLALGVAKDLLNKEFIDAEEVSFVLNDNEKMLCGIHLGFNKDIPYDFILKNVEKNHFLDADFYYLNAERIGPRLEYKVDNFKHAGYNGEYAVQIIANVNLETDEHKSFSEEIPNMLRNQAHAWLEDITPGVTIQGADVYHKIRTAQMTISNTTPTNVGFGVSYVLPIIVNGLLAQPNSIFIVENPEAHLHPSAQSRIGRFLAKIAATGVNVIVETHSEHVINGIRIATLSDDYGINTDDVIINFFYKEKNKQPQVKKIKITESGNLDDFPRDFFDQLQQDLAELIALKRARKEGGKP
jgi:predicted ATPase